MATPNLKSVCPGGADAILLSANPYRKGLLSMQNDPFRGTGNRNYRKYSDGELGAFPGNAPSITAGVRYRTLIL